MAPFHTFTRVYPTPGDARAAIGTAAPRWTHALMMPTPLAASRAHSLVGDACVRWQLPQLLHPAPVVVSELAGNAIEHAATEFDATASISRMYLRIAVHDGAPAPPRMLPHRRSTPAAPPADRGRGLLIVNATATHWGSTPVDGGKIVCALLRADLSTSTGAWRRAARGRSGRR